MSRWIWIITCGALLAACADGPTGLVHPTDAIRFPTAILLDSDERHLYVVNSNFDQRYRTATLAVVDLKRRVVVPGRTLGIDPFAGRPVAVRSDGATIDELVLVSRSHDSVTRVDVAREGSAPRLRCGDADDQGLTICDGLHRLGEVEGVDTGREPFAAALIASDDPADRLLATVAMASGAVRFFRWCAPDEAGCSCSPEDTGCTQGFAAAGEATLRNRVGSAALDVQEALFHPQTGDLLTTHRTSSDLLALPVAVGLGPDGLARATTGASRAVPIPSSSTARQFGRGLAIDASGRVAVAWRGPDSLVFLEPDAETGSGYRRTAQVSVGRGPTAVRFAPFGPGGATRAFVTCANDDHLFAVDPIGGVVTGVVPTGAGPFDLAVVDSPAGRFVVTSDFEDDSLTVVDADPESDRYLQAIARIHAGGSDR